MKVFYTLKENSYNAADVELALKCAEAASKQYGWPVRALIETLQDKGVFSGVQDFEEQSSNKFKFNSITGEITSRRQFQGGAGEIIVAVCPTIQLLKAVQQNSTRIKLLIVVPDMDASVNQDIYLWLDLNSAIDIRSSQPLQGIHQPAAGVKRAIGYLIDYCQRMNVDLTHTTVQTGVMADVVNTIKKQGITANYNEVVKYSLRRDLTFAEAEILAKAFCQRTLLKTRGCPNYDAYWTSIDDPKWE